MNPPMINSTNSVSTSKKKREAERSVNWTVEETQVLLCAWSDERIQKSLAENLRNRHVFKHLSARMSELGFSRSPHQCRLRVKTLKANYVRAKLQKSVDSSQPCNFKYFAEMDAVLGRRGAVEAGEGEVLRLGSVEGMVGRHLGSIERMGNMRPNLSSEAEVGVHHFGSLERTGGRHLGSVEERRGRQSWPMSLEVKMEEDIEYSTDEFEFIDAGFSRPLRDKRHDVYLESTIHHQPIGAPVEDSLTTPSPLPHPPPPLPPPQPVASPLPPPPDPSPGATPTSTHPHHHHLQSDNLEPVLKHLSECFQSLVSETRGLLVQLEGQRQEQARWHRELLAHWLEREERRQREAADREERREKARMEHEIRVLELLTNLAQQRTAAGGERRCGGSQTVVEQTTGLNHKTEDGNMSDAS